MLPKRYIKIYKRKYVGWLQGETRKLHKISEDKNLTESLHSIPCEIWHGVRKSLHAHRPSGKISRIVIFPFYSFCNR